MNQLERNLLDLFGSYNNFPKEGIVFCDILPVLRDSNVFSELINSMSQSSGIKNSDAIVAIDARGFIFGTAISLVTKKPLICARKPGKLPGDLISDSYELEYGENTLCIQSESIKNFISFSIIDDLLATGGTAACVEKILLSQGKVVNELAVVVELEELKGRNKLNCEVNSQVTL
jgi:adenine phosphoribosyltransferase